MTSLPADPPADPSDQSNQTSQTDQTSRSGQTDAPAAPEARHRRLLPVVLLVALAILALDQTTKYFAMAELADRPPVRVIGDFLTLRLVRNAGAAFGLATGFTIVLTVIATSVVVVIVRMARRLASLPWAIALGMLLGGAMGNLGDRMFRDPAPLRGHVVDFLALPNWPVFNFADCSIVTAGALMVLVTFRGINLDGTRVTNERDTPGPAATPADHRPH